MVEVVKLGACRTREQNKIQMFSRVGSLWYLNNKMTKLKAKEAAKNSKGQSCFDDPREVIEQIE